jgi:aryl-alcohol dehydrogenase-like predicted oxidoreductase
MRLTASDVTDGVARSLLHALERGVTSIDTAAAYGPSEEVVGRTLREFRGSERPFVMTKVQPLPTGNWRHYVPLTDAFTAASIEASAERSLRALGVEVIDLLQLHQWYHPWTYEPEWREAFDRLTRAGKVRFTGVSAQDHEHDAVLGIVDRRTVDAVQFVMNVFEPRPLVGLVPLARQRGVGTIARCVLDCGGLGGMLDERAMTDLPYFAKAPPAEYQRRLAALRELCGSGPDAVAADVAELALRFVLTDPGISTLTISMNDPRLVDATLAAAAAGPLNAAAFDQLRREHAWFKNFWIS